MFNNYQIIFKLKVKKMESYNKQLKDDKFFFISSLYVI